MSSWTDNRGLSTPLLQIAVIDDDALVLNVLCEMLEDRGHCVACFKSPATALAALGTRRYDAVLCDIRMPEMTGIEFFQHLTAKHPHYFRRVIFLTGDVFMPDTQRFLTGAGCLCLLKPFRRAALDNALALVTTADGAGSDQEDQRIAA